MNWKYILVGIVGTACLFGFLATWWCDLHPLADLYLEAIVITPEGAR